MDDPIDFASGDIFPFAMDLRPGQFPSLIKCGLLIKYLRCRVEGESFLSHDLLLVWSINYHSAPLLWPISFANWLEVVVLKTIGDMHF